MKLATHMTTLQLSALTVDYKWDWDDLIPFRETTVEDSPRLAAALDPINTKAVFCLGVTCVEWVVARVEGHVDTSDDVLKRIEAAWAAAIDPRYTSLPQPPRSKSSYPQEFVRPLHLATLMLSDLYSAYTSSTRTDRVYAGTQGLIMLVSYLAGRHKAVEPALTELLRRCHEHYPDLNVPIEEQKPVPREFFEPSFVWSEDAVDESIRNYIKTLDPSTNPYLHSADDMLADGFVGQPYTNT